MNYSQSLHITSEKQLTNSMEMCKLTDTYITRSSSSWSQNLSTLTNHVLYFLPVRPERTWRECYMYWWYFICNHRYWCYFICNHRTSWWWGIKKPESLYMSVGKNVLDTNFYCTVVRGPSALWKVWTPTSKTFWNRKSASDCRPTGNKTLPGSGQSSKLGLQYPKRGRKVR